MRLYGLLRPHTYWLGSVRKCRGWHPNWLMASRAKLSPKPQTLTIRKQGGQVLSPALSHACMRKPKGSPCTHGGAATALFRTCPQRVSQASLGRCPSRCGQVRSPPWGVWGGCVLASLSAVPASAPAHVVCVAGVAAAGLVPFKTSLETRLEGSLLWGHNGKHEFQSSPYSKSRIKG